MTGDGGGVIGIDAVGVVSTDLARSVTFYRLLGVEFPEGDELGPHVEGTLPGGTRLMLDSEELIRSIDDGWEPGGPGRVTLAVRCASADAVDALYARLETEGYGHRSPWDAPWGQRYASAHDPDGTAIDLYAWLPGAAPG